METTNGYSFEIKNQICYLSIPKTQGEFNLGVQEAKREICLNHNLPYFKEIKIKKL